MYPVTAASNFASHVQAIPDTCPASETEEILKKWMRFQVFWPRKVLSPSFLNANLNAYYVPCWLVDSVEASAKWSATVLYETSVVVGGHVCGSCNGEGVQRTYASTNYELLSVDKCEACDGKGVIEQTESRELTTTYSSKASIKRKNELLPSAKGVKLLFQPNLGDKWKNKTLSTVSEISLLEVDTTLSPNDSANVAAEKFLLRNIAVNGANDFNEKSKLGTAKEVYDLTLKDVKAKFGKFSPVAYPVFLGTYAYQGQE